MLAVLSAIKDFREESYLQYVVLLTLMVTGSGITSRTLCELYRLEKYITVSIVILITSFTTSVMGYIDVVYIDNIDNLLHLLHDTELPSNIWPLIEKYRHKKCVLCQYDWIMCDGCWIILVCGHCYHKSCLRKWELQQKKQKCLKCTRYKCAICKKLYNWRNKWIVGTQQINELYHQGIWIVDT